MFSVFHSFILRNRTHLEDGTGWYVKTLSYDLLVQMEQEDHKEAGQR